MTSDTFVRLFFFFEGKDCLVYFIESWLNQLGKQKKTCGGTFVIHTTKFEIYKAY